MSLTLSGQHETNTNEKCLADIFDETNQLRTRWRDILVWHLKEILWSKKYNLDIERSAGYLYDQLYGKWSGPFLCKATIEFLPSTHGWIQWINDVHREIRENILSLGGTPPTNWLDGYRLHLWNDLHVSLNGKWTGAYGVENDIAQNQLTLTFIYAHARTNTQKNLIEVLVEK